MVRRRNPPVLDFLISPLKFILSKMSFYTTLTSCMSSLTCCTSEETSFGVAKMIALPTVRLLCAIGFFSTEDTITCKVLLQCYSRCYYNAPGTKMHPISLRACCIYSSDLCSWQPAGVFYQATTPILFSYPKILHDWCFTVLFCRNTLSY